jgi:hypothetical protein
MLTNHTTTTYNTPKAKKNSQQAATIHGSKYLTDLG